MPAVNVDQFLEVLEQSNLLSADAVARVRAEAAGGGSEAESKELARKLVERKILTQWQAEMLLAGRHAFFLGRYKLLERIGSGGMGSVFKAQQEPLGRLVAIKVISRKLMKNQESVQRFYREIQSAASLDHPNIVAAYDADHAGKTYFLVMEYVDGEDLGSVVKRRGALPVGEACHYIMQAAQGLQHAFERHLVHRDIKPSNLLVTRASGSHEPVVKLLDMGLARVEDDEDAADLTHTGQIMGTPDYIAPEQARDSKSADVRSDVFSLGCTLFRLLTNQVPFGGNTLMEKLLARSEKDAPPVSSLRRDAPLPLDAIVSRMIARDPADRYQTPAQVAAALAPFAHISVETPSRAVVREAESAPFDIVPVAEIPEAAPVIQTGSGSEIQQFLQDLGSEASFMGMDDPSTQSQAGATPFTPHVVTATSQDEKGSKSSHAQTGIHRRRQSTSSLRWYVLGGVGAFLLLLAGIVGWSWAGQTTLIVDWPPEERAGGTLTVDGERINLPSDGPISISGSAGRREVVIARKGYERIRETLSLERAEVRNFAPQWTPTSSTVRKDEFAALRAETDKLENGPPDRNRAAATRGRIVEFQRKHAGTAEAADAAWLLWKMQWPVDQLRSENLADAERSLAGNGVVSFAPKQLVAVFGDGRLTHSYRNVHSVAYSPDGTLLASSGNDEYIRLWNSATGEPVLAIHAQHSHPHALSFSPDGKRLAAAVLDFQVKIWSVETGELMGELPQHTHRLFDVAFSPDGKTIATSDDAGAQLFDVETGKRLHHWPEQRYDLGFNADGSLLATCSSDNEKKINLWNTQTGEPIETDWRGYGLLTVQREVLAFWGEQNSLELWDWKDGGVAHRVTVPVQGGWRTPAISSDGKLAAVVQGAQIVLLDSVAGEQLEWTAAGIGANAVRCLNFSPDGQTLAAGFQDGSVRLFDTATGKERLPPAAHHGIITAVDVSPDGRRIATAGLDGAACLWDVATGKVLYRIPAHLKDLHDVAFLQNGKVLATAGHDNMIRLWDAETGKRLHEMHEHLRPVWALAIHPDGVHLASGGEDRRIHIWNTESRKEEKVLQEQAHSVVCLAYSPDGRYLAAGTFAAHVDGLVVWDMQTGKPLNPIKISDIGCKIVDVKFSADGTRIFYVVRGAGLDGVHVWDLRKARSSRAPFDGAYDEARLACQPQNHLWARSIGEGALYVHDTRYGIEEHRCRFGQNYCYVGDVAFTPDGRHVVVGMGAGAVCILRLQEWNTGMQKPSADPFP